MNWDLIEGRWQELRGTIREKWGKLTNDDIEVIAGKKDRLIGKLHARYGLAKDEAEKELNTFIDGIDKSSTQKTETKSATSNLATTKII